MKKQVYVVVGKSESGDDYLAVFAKQPTKAQLKELCVDWDSTEEMDGPGFAGTYVHISVQNEDVL